MKIRFFSMVAAALTLAACGSSPPTHFFALTAVAPVGRPPDAPAFPVQVAAVHIPAMLDREAMVRRTGPTALSISDQDRWGAPLDDMARNVLAQDLAERMPEGSVILPGAPLPSSTALLVVNIASFTQDADRRVTLDGSWALMHGRPAKTILDRDVSLECKTDSDDAAAQAAAMSQLLAKLADHIAITLSTTSLQAASDHSSSGRQKEYSAPHSERTSTVQIRTACAPDEKAGR